MAVRHLILPKIVREVVVAVDPDPVGLMAARAAARRWLGEGVKAGGSALHDRRSVSILTIWPGARDEHDLIPGAYSGDRGRSVTRIQRRRSRPRIRRASRR
jgi:hypothetical protein